MPEASFGYVSVDPLMEFPVKHDAHANILPRDFTDSRLGRVFRLGLATRGNTRLDREDVLAAIERGINYLNWCGHPDGLRDAVRALGNRRQHVRIAVQLESRDAVGARRELDAFLGELGTDYLDLVTYYYVEHPDEWDEIVGENGAAKTLEQARHEGVIRAIGLTSHQRPLAATAAASGRLDWLMIRYNAAHRGAEREVFPVTVSRGIPIVAFTCLRWGGLLQKTSADPPGCVLPRPVDCYRFVLSEPAVSVALMAPNGSSELFENLSLLDDWRGLTASERSQLLAHGERVRQYAGGFP